ncbi:gamma-glutamyl-gamma-aminobutyrate hydrolase [Streptomyces mashuensis]|uniref:Gamma-glutamyl-gamma-aminobutyrate hydrolase n=1 Tax=Streptomyces mashuensis TaxID=33904 RepID=A0A919B162_9ACTN|nr:gamma-glutamyl-gamma-aminobutyrate hydrolase family protein [Streptomyces mashuensis]GHF40002.1 gamma-glutamyl-gamma-aminobutyrate hydrolase [Streptomyces mashuensis]
MTTATTAAGARPLIGISTYWTQARWGVAWDLPAALLPASYPAYVQAAGGLAVMLPPDGSTTAAAAAAATAAAETVRRLDGLLLAGGDDLDPALYGAPPHPRTGRPVPERDRWELALLAAALDQRVPVLGVCRGMQLMNVHAGGTLVQHLPDVVGHDGHNPKAGTFTDHTVTPVPGSLTARLLGPHPRPVATHHHQAVDRLGEGLRVSAHAEDGTAEALEYVAHDGFALGIQWHPEAGTDPGPGRALVEAAAGRCRGAGRTGPAIPG